MQISIQFYRCLKAGIPPGLLNSIKKIVQCENNGNEYTAALRNVSQSVILNKENKCSWSIYLVLQILKLVKDNQQKRLCDLQNL